MRHAAPGRYTNTPEACENAAKGHPGSKKWQIGYGVSTVTYVSARAIAWAGACLHVMRCTPSCAPPCPTGRDRAQYWSFLRKLTTGNFRSRIPPRFSAAPPNIASPLSRAQAAGWLLSPATTAGQGIEQVVFSGRGARRWAGFDDGHQNVFQASGRRCLSRAAGGSFRKRKCATRTLRQAWGLDTWLHPVWRSLKRGCPPARCRSLIEPGAAHGVP